MIVDMSPGHCRSPSRESVARQTTTTTTSSPERKTPAACVCRSSGLRPSSRQTHAAILIDIRRAVLTLIVAQHGTCSAPTYPAATMLPGAKASAFGLPESSRPLARNPPVRIRAISPASPKQTGSSPKPRDASCDLPHPGPPEAQIPMDHRLAPAGLGTADFPTLHGVRNSKRLRNGRFGLRSAEKLPFVQQLWERPLASRAVRRLLGREQTGRFGLRRPDSRH